MIDENLEKKRHSLSHIMAAAIKELYPEAEFAIGPVVENGFYYDIDFAETKVSEDDLKTIEKKMKHLLKNNAKMEMSEKSIDEAIKEEEKNKAIYKKELLDDLKEEGEKQVSYYEIYGFKDLCRGPHIEETKEIEAGSFSLQKIAGAYWRGDETNKMLTRIYGLAFNTKAELESHLKFLKEAEKRDHRKIGKEQELFMIDPMVGLGLAMWQPKGALLWRIMEEFWYKEHLRGGYELVRTPHIGSRKLWETSGHWGFYSDSMYPTIEVGQTLKAAQEGQEVDKESKEEYLLKPMNCPFHVMLYNNKPRSYRDLPVRWAETGTVYRYEKHGELSGLTRVRGFTQDDAHIICTKEMVKDELKRVARFIAFIFESFGFREYKVYLSLRDPKNKEKYAGNDEGWDFTQKVLKEVADEENLDYTVEEGEAAFYGPKLDYKIKDCLGREWQCSTLQFDFNLPERFDMTFVNDKGEKERPYMLHRALFGSFERFIGVLIEHYEGAFPVWLSPTQVKIISVGEAHREYCEKLADEFRAQDIRVEVDSEDETVSSKIRKATSEKAPYMLVVGDKEMGGSVLAVRDRGQRESREIEKEEFFKEIEEKVKLKQ
ncbi:threonine--tRNA ligase [Candidatus Parcubacteria bacterium]|nr:MAG: threonine--tRNA ligase [Candidatus Parcubacteria bacterium]